MNTQLYKLLGIDENGQKYIQNVHNSKNNN